MKECLVMVNIMANGSGKKLWFGIMQMFGAFFDKNHTPPALRWLILFGIGFVILWQSGWNWWYLLEVIATIMWVLFAIIIFFIIQRLIINKKKYGK